MPESENWRARGYSVPYKSHYLQPKGTENEQNWSTAIFEDRQHIMDQSATTSSQQSLLVPSVFDTEDVAGSQQSSTNLSSQQIVLTAHGRPAKCYTCIYCFKLFRHKNDFRKHVATHTGEKPHGCPYCDLSFTQRGTLRNHMKRIHQQELPSYI